MLGTQKGITLVALVITIIVLLILAAVTITIVLNGGLIPYAQNAASDTVRAAALENAELATGTAKAAILEAKVTSGSTLLTEEQVLQILEDELTNKDVTLDDYDDVAYTVDVLFKTSTTMGTITLTLDD